MTGKEKAVIEEWTVTQEEADAEMYAHKKHCINCISCGNCLESAIEDRCESYRKSYKDYLRLAEGKPEWHDLKEAPNDLPKCAENEQIIFYVHEYYKDIERYINHYCLGFYKKSFMDDDVKLFVERSKGYECEHSTEDVLYWCELPKFEG